VEGTYFTADVPLGWFSQIVEQGASYKNATGTVEIQYYTSSLKGDSDTDVSETFGVGFQTSEDLEAVIEPLLGGTKYELLEARLDQGGSIITALESTEYDAGVWGDYSFWSDTTRLIITEYYATLAYDLSVGFDGHSLFVAIVAYNLSTATASEVAEGFGITQSFKSSYISNPLGDNDGDGLLNYREILLTRTDPNSKDTHGDGIKDAGALAADIPPRVDYTPLVNAVKAAERSSVIQEIKDDPAVFDLFTASQVVSAETAARKLGQDDVTTDPSSYSLYTSSDVGTAEAASRTLGQADVTSDPATYDLFTQVQLDARAESTTQAIILNPSSAGLFAQTDLDAASAAATSATSAAIVLDPASVGLFSQINLDEAISAATQAIILDPSTVGLFASQEAIYFSFGQSLIELDKDSLTLDWSLMRTDDLSVWEEIGKVEIAVPKQEVPYFFRFELNQ